MFPCTKRRAYTIMKKLSELPGLDCARNEAINADHEALCKRRDRRRC